MAQVFEAGEDGLGDLIAARSRREIERGSDDLLAVYDGGNAPLFGSLLEGLEQGLVVVLLRLGQRVGGHEGPGAAHVHVGKLAARLGIAQPTLYWHLPNKAALAEWDELDNNRFHLHGSACYCSIFDECRVTDFDDSKPKPVASCDNDPTPHKS